MSRKQLFKHRRTFILPFLIALGFLLWYMYQGKQVQVQPKEKQEKVKPEEVEPPKDVFITDTLLKYTPVKDQGDSELCWVYAMLATIETEHLMQGDSVNLSPLFLARVDLEEQAQSSYLYQGIQPISMRGIAGKTVSLMQKYGITHYQAFHKDVNFNVLARKIMTNIDNAVSKKTTLQVFMEEARAFMDKEIGILPKQVFMLGVEYTPLEFAHSVCREDEYQGYSSFTHHPFGEEFELEVPDNSEGEAFINIPIDSLEMKVIRALKSGHPVCWEGDTSNDMFSFKDGIARRNDTITVDQESRQHAFETFETTDDHCMTIIGMAHDRSGGRYFICKNSWGKDNPFGGLMYMSDQYFRQNTIAIWLSEEKKEGKKPKKSSRFSRLSSRV